MPAATKKIKKHTFSFHKVENVFQVHTECRDRPVLVLADIEFLVSELSSNSTQAEYDRFLHVTGSSNKTYEPSYF
jgi:hypothetical protein